jgi:hypothetical protein
MAEDEAPRPWTRRKVGPGSVAVVALVLAAVVVGGVLAWRQESVQIRYRLWEVCRGREPGPHIHKLRAMGARVVPYVAEAIKNAEGDSRRWLLDLLAEVSCPDGAAIARPFLRSPEVQVRVSALGVFQTCGREKDLTDVYEMLKDPDSGVLYMACIALARITGHDLDPEPELWHKYFKDRPQLLKPKGGSG